MGNLERLAIGVSSIGGVTGIGVFLNKSLYTDSIRSKLLANKFEILNNKDQYGHWERIFDVYQKLNGEEATKFKFSNPATDNKEALQKRCEEILKKRVGESNEENNLYGKAERWCTVPNTVLKVLEKERTILNTEEKIKDDPDKEEWDKKIKEYISSKNEEEKIKDFTLPVKPSSGSSGQDEKNMRAIKDKCKEFNSKKSYDEGYAEALKKSRTWCTVEKKNSESK